MEGGNRRFKPLLDRIYYIICGVSALLVATVVVIPALDEPRALFLTVPLAVLLVYFLVSPLFGYVELRDETLFVKFGFFLKKEIPYSRIRGAEIVRKVYADSMLSLKNALEHVNIKYNTYDVVSVSVVGNDELVAELNERCAARLKQYA